MSDTHIDVDEQRSGTFAGFKGYSGTVDTDEPTEHDEWGIE